MLERSNSLKEAHKMEVRREKEEFNNRYSSEKLKAGKYNYFRDVNMRNNSVLQQIKRSSK